MSAFNPPAGHIATANNKIVPDSYPYLITRDWDAPYRIERIEAGLAETLKQSTESSMRLQADIVSLSAKELLPLMLVAKPRSAREVAAIDLLRRWDHRMDPDRPEPLLFASWIRALNRRLFQPRLGTIYGRYWSATARVTLTVLRDKPSWCGSEGCPALIEGALEEALGPAHIRLGDQDIPPELVHQRPPAYPPHRVGDERADQFRHRADDDHRHDAEVPLTGQDPREPERDLRRNRDATGLEKAEEKHGRQACLAEKALHSSLLYRMRGTVPVGIGRGYASFNRRI